MEYRGSPAELAAAEGEGWFAAPGIVLWRVGGIDGASFAGRVSTAQVDAAFAVVRQYGRAASARPIDVVTDLSAMTSFEDGVYLRLSTHVAELVPPIAARVRRHVLVAPDGVIRATAAGFLHLNVVYGWHIAADLRAAVGATLAERIEPLVDAARDADLVTALRAQVVADTLPAAARALGVAPRSLQRALRRAGTSFRSIVEKGRIAAACRLLDETDLKVESIAFEVGFGSLSGFVRSFRRVRGCSPHERRVRRLAG